MNERIRELIEQSGAGDVTPVGFHKYLEKFAELIVAECAELAKHNVMNISTYADAEFVDQQIMKHFGVEL